VTGLKQTDAFREKIRIHDNTEKPTLKHQGEARLFEKNNRKNGRRSTLLDCHQPNTNITQKSNVKPYKMKTKRIQKQGQWKRNSYSEGQNGQQETSSESKHVKGTCSTESPVRCFMKTQLSSRIIHDLRPQLLLF
jgi:hypothetical protein